MFPITTKGGHSFGFPDVCLTPQANLMDYHHGRFIPRDSGIVCQMPTCNNAAEAYLPKTGQPVCLQCYKTETIGSYPIPSDFRAVSMPTGPKKVSSHTAGSFSSQLSFSQMLGKDNTP